MTLMFSDGFGMKFDFVYSLGMVVVLLGLFNVMTATLVEATVCGLKDNEIKMKERRLCEAQFMRKKLEAFMQRVYEIMQQEDEPCDAPAQPRSWQVSRIGSVTTRLRRPADMVLMLGDMKKVLQDAKIKDLLLDMDVIVEPHAVVVEMFDTSRSSTVDMSQLISTLMRLRGDPHKGDMVTTWVALRALNSKFDDFELNLLENQKRIIGVELAVHASTKQMLKLQRQEAARPPVVGLPATSMHQTPAGTTRPLVARPPTSEPYATELPDALPLDAIAQITELSTSVPPEKSNTKARL